MTPTDDELEGAVREFRRAIDETGPQPWIEKGIKFPRGACGHAAELLGMYLKERMGITANYVNEMAYEDIGGWENSHAWLEWNGLTIDITGDQFGWEPVIVTRHPIFHGRGKDRISHAVCLEHQADWWARECGPLWSSISLQLNL